MPRRTSDKVVQAWVELRSDDPEAISALSVARSCLAAGRDLRSLRRMRLLEIAGRLPSRDAVESLLHRSTQFYNPHKERCVLRLEGSEAVPLAARERAVVVIERGQDRRPAAERWWRHETGETVEVREGVAWALSFDEGVDAETALEELALVRGRRQGLLCNPHSQQCRVAGASVPVPWLTEAAATSRPARRRSTRSTA